MKFKPTRALTRFLGSVVRIDWIDHFGFNTKMSSLLEIEKSVEREPLVLHSYGRLSKVVGEYVILLVTEGENPDGLALFIPAIRDVHRLRGPK